MDKPPFNPYDIADNLQIIKETLDFDKLDTERQIYINAESTRNQKFGLTLSNRKIDATLHLHTK